ncbi:MAG: hypothetical protein ACSLE6_06450 [Mycobacterium sp.]
MNDNTNGWPAGNIDWRYHPADTPAVAAQVIQVITHMIRGDAEAATRVVMDSGLPVWRHAPVALAILCTTIGARSTEGENVVALTDQLLDEHAPGIASTMTNRGHNRDVELTVMSAVKYWAASDYDGLTRLAHTSPLHAAWWTWGACMILARICEGDGGAAWLMKIAQMVADGIGLEGESK